MNGKTERVNEVLEDMLRMYMMQQRMMWEYYIHFVEFSYNKGYEESLKMSPFQALHGRRCRTPMKWSSPETKFLLGPEILKAMEREVKRI